MEDLLFEDSLLESMEVVHHQESEESYADDFLFEDSLLESMEVISFEERDIDEVVRENAHALLDAEMDLEEILYETGIDIVTEGVGSSLKEWAKKLWGKIVDMWKKFIEWIKNLFRKSDSVESSKSSSDTKKTSGAKKNNEKHSGQEKDTHNDNKETNKQHYLGAGHQRETKSYSVKSEPIDRSKSQPEQKTKQFKSKMEIAKGFKFQAPYHWIDWIFFRDVLGTASAAESHYKLFKNDGDDLAKLMDEESDDILNECNAGIEKMRKKGEEPQEIADEIINSDGSIIPLKETLSIQKFLEKQRDLENARESIIRLAEIADSDNTHVAVKRYIAAHATCVTKSMQFIVTAVKVNKNSRSKCIASYKKELNKYVH